MADPIQLNSVGLDQVVAIFAHLHQRNVSLDQQVTYLQEVSTEQVERIRALEAQVRTMQERHEVEA